MADQRILYTERVTGAGHPTRPDTLNRLTMVEHNSDGTHDTTKVAPASKGVTNGDLHDHTGGDGAQIAHASLLNAGTNTHAQIDSALSRLTNTSGTNTGDQDLTGFATTSSVTSGLAAKQDTLISGTNIKTINGTAVLGSGNMTISTGVTDHLALTNIGTYTHGQIDSHITSTNNPHATSAAQIGFANKLTLDKIGESLGDPTWNGGAWPGGSGSTTTAYVDAGIVIAPSFLDNADGSVTIGSGEYVLYLTAETLPPQRYAVTGGTFTLVDNTVNYIIITCNSGSPVMSSTTSRAGINQLDVIPVYTIFRSGTSLIYLEWEYAAIGLANKINDRLVRTKRFEVEPGGLSIGEDTGRVVTITSGYIWAGHDRNFSAAYRSGTDPLNLYYKVAGVWTKSIITSYNNTQYDDGNNLQVLSGGRYAVNWVVKRVAEPSGCVYIIMGGGDYTLAQAQTSTVPVLPPEVNSLGVLVGRIIVLKNATTATQIDSVLTVPIGSTSVADHAQLSNLQGGTTGEYYHLTNAELTKLGGIAAGAEVNVNADWDAVSGDAQILNKPATYAPSAHTINSHSDWPATVDMTEVGYLNGVTSAIQTQLLNKQATLVNESNIRSVNGQSLVGSGGITVTGGMSASSINSNTTAVKDTRYVCDTSAGAFTLTLPAAPVIGDYIEVVDSDGTWATNNLTVARNALKINGLAEDLVLNVSNTFVTFTYGDVTRGWQVDIGGSALVSTPADNSVTYQKLFYDGGRTPYAFFKADFASVAFTKTGAGALSIKAGAFCLVGTSNTMVSWPTQTAITMPSHTIGTDYCIYACADGSIRADANATNPTGYDTSNSRKIGGYHYGRVRNSLTVTDVATEIVPRSLWDLTYRPKCNPAGMVDVHGNGSLWADIYIAAVDSAITLTSGVVTAGTCKSIYNGTPLSGTEGLHGYNFIELAKNSGKRLLSHSEWLAVAHGSPQGNDGDNLNAWSATTNSARTGTGQVARAVSFCGACDCVGNVWEWLDEFSNDHTTTAYGWQNPMTGQNVGQLYLPNATGLRQYLAGSHWAAGVIAGSRALHADLYPWTVNTAFGSRFACDGL